MRVTLTGTSVSSNQSCPLPTKCLGMMTEAFVNFISRVDHLENRYKGVKYGDRVLMPLDLLIAVRDEMKQPGLFTDSVDQRPERSIHASLNAATNDQNNS